MTQICREAEKFGPEVIHFSVCFNKIPQLSQCETLLDKKLERIDSELSNLKTANMNISSQSCLCQSSLLSDDIHQ